MMPRNSAPKPRGRPFKKGNPGKPKGTRHRVTRAVEELLDGEAEALTRKAIELAMDGDMTALRLCLERVCPARKDTPIVVSLPKVTAASDAVDASRAILTAVAAGSITPSEGAALSGLVENWRRAAETEELDQRITDLEKQAGVRR